MFDSTMVRRLPAVAVLAATAMLAGGLQAQTQFFVPPNLPAGSQYQLVFVTAGQTTGSYTLEDGYNSFVTGQAAPLTAILPAGTTWDAVTSTLGDGIAAGVNAPTYANIPIYNTGGQLVAANGYGFWSNTHQNAIDFDQYGQAIGYYVWTGTDWNGQPMPGATLGTTVPECGWSGDTDGTWTAYWAYFSSSDGFSFYGLSSVITVPPFSIAWTSTGGGSWSNASNWGGNVVPGGYPGTAAVFGTVIGSGTATVTLDGNWTPGALTFSTTGGGSYIITLAPGDTHFLTLTGTGTSVPLVSSGGNHTIAVPLWLENNLAVSAAPGSTLTVSGPIYGGGDSLALTGGGELVLSGSYISVSYATVSAGTLAVTGTVTVGNGLTADTGGTYTLGGGWLSAPNEYVGYSGTGNFTQSGGTNYNSSSFYLGSGSGSSGTYNLSGGSLYTPNEYVGYSGAGTFTQSGGTNTITGNNFAIGYNPGSSGCYSLGGGWLSAPNEQVGYSGTGNFTQSGGTNYNSSSFYLGFANTGSGAYSLSGGSLYTPTPVKVLICYGFTVYGITSASARVTTGWRRVNGSREAGATRMLLGKSLAVFIERSPVSVMVSATLERVFEPAVLDRVFQEHAVLGYAKELAFSQCVQIMCDVVFKESPSVGAFYQAHPDEIPVTRQAVYDKLKRLESQVPAALVHYSGVELSPCVKAMRSQAPPLLPRYRVRVLDGNHLTGTEHRIFELRRFRSAALPGQALVFYDPQYGLITDVVPCEDAHAQERSLLKEALACISARDCILADRNFCTSGFLFGIRRLRAFFIIRQHASTLCYELKGKRHLAGQDDRGRDIYEQAIRLTDPESGESFTARRITIVLDKPNKDGETELHILTNLPKKAASAVRIAELYADRWTIETGFQQLTDDLRCEIDTLGYPKAALFGFCTACMAYNAVSVVKCAIRAAQGRKYVEEELSMYYLTLEVAQVTAGMMIAIPEQDWGVFRKMSHKKFATVLIDLAQRIDPRKYTKHKRGPKTKQPKKTSGKRIHHVSTARILAMRT